MVKPGAAVLSPDLVDLIFEYVIAEFPQAAERAAEMKAATRREFGGEQAYVPRRSQEERARLTREILVLFNGRNAIEISRRLNISRAQVYRIIKQAGK